ncbi:MAG: hypothetical protein WC504_10590 [Methylobacter sp.]
MFQLGQGDAGMETFPILKTWKVWPVTFPNRGVGTIKTLRGENHG